MDSGEQGAANVNGGALVICSAILLRLQDSGCASAIVQMLYIITFIISRIGVSISTTPTILQPRALLLFFFQLKEMKKEQMKEKIIS